MARISCVGGPADGAQVAAVADAYRWIDPGTERGYAAQRAGAALYRRSASVYVFVGYHTRPCGGCGALLNYPLGLLDVCPLCGCGVTT